jgi:hypothetical protein
VGQLHLRGATLANNPAGIDTSKLKATRGIFATSRNVRGLLAQKGLDVVVARSLARQARLNSTP